MRKNKSLNLSKYTIWVIVLLIILSLGIYKASQPNMKEAEKIANMVLDGHQFSIANNGVVLTDKLSEIKEMNYEELKQSMNIRTDFCIYIEDTNGNIILAKGSSRLNEYGLHCSD